MYFAEIEEGLVPESRIERIQSAAARLFEPLDHREVALVIRVADAARVLRLAWLAAIMTRLGNGALYPLLAAVLIATRTIEAPARFVVTVTLNLVIALTLYPLLKNVLGRMRPCDYEPELARFGKPLDHYSCPSGHTMTVVTFSITVVFAWPAGAVVAIPLCMVMGWSRIALGHHYPTDVLLGGVIGAAVATPVAAFVY